MRLPLRRWVFPVWVSLVAAAGLARAGDVEIVVRGVEPGGGSIRVAAFASAADFEAGRPVAGVVTAATQRLVRVVLPSLVPGRYGFAVFQDDDANRRISKNFFGIPKEAYGFSNHARGRMGPPAFEAIELTVGTSAMTIEIELE